MAMNDFSCCCFAGTDKMCPQCLRNAKNYPPDRTWKSMISPKQDEDGKCVSWIVQKEADNEQN